MRIERRQAFFAIVAFLMGASGCGNSVKDVCQDLGEKCPDVLTQECMTDGNSLESIAKSKGCDDQFGAFLDCVADQRCSYREACETERAALEKCTGQFPE